MGNNWTSDSVTPSGNLSLNFKYEVTLGGKKFGFASVEGIKTSRSFEFYEEGGVNDHKIHVGKPQDDVFELVFTRGLMIKTSTALADAAMQTAASACSNNSVRKAALTAAALLSSQTVLEVGPAVGTIIVYSTLKRNKVIGKYSFLSLGVKDWTLSGLDAKGSEVLIETFTVLHTGITRVSLSSDSDTSIEARHVIAAADPRDAAAETAALMEEQRRANAELAAKVSESLQSMGDKLKEEKEKKDAMDQANAEIAQSVSEQLEAMREKMEEEYENAQKLNEEWQKLREEGIKKTEEMREIAKEKAKEYQKKSKELTDAIIKAEEANLEKIREYSKELAKTTSKASEMAKKSADKLALEVNKFREAKRQNAEALAKETEEMEKAKLEAIKTMELSRAMAQASRDAAKELQAKNWEETKQKNLEEAKKATEEMTNAAEESAAEAENSADATESMVAD